MQMNTTVVLVDDHSIVRQGMSALLSTVDELELVGEAGDGKEAIELVRELTPTLVVVDLLMPNTDGVGLIRALRLISPSSRLAVLTSSEDDQLAFAAIEAGAHAFLLKSMSGDELLQAIQRVLADEVVIHPAITRRILSVVRSIRRPEENAFASLSERELDVLRVLADGASNARVADTLSISVTTVKTHIGNILSKLHLGDRTEAVAFAWRHGLMNGG
jgi:DNA-binding NarL/FixJ family response regulator